MNSYVRSRTYITGHVRPSVAYFSPSFSAKTLSGCLTLISKLDDKMEKQKSNAIISLFQ